MNRLDILTMEMLRDNYADKTIGYKEAYICRLAAIIFYFHDTYGLTMRAIKGALSA